MTERIESAISAAQLARGLWERMEARDWDGVRVADADDVVLDWPRLGERIRGPDNFVALNRGYRGEWHITVERVVAAGNSAVTEVAVRFAGEPDREEA